MPARHAVSDSLSGPPAGAAETVPVENETSERVVRTLVFGLPLAALVVGGMAGVGRKPALARPGRARDHLHPHRAGHHGRLPPAVHPPQLQNYPRGAGVPRRPRLDGRRGPGDRVGRHSPQAPQLLRPVRRPAQPPRRPLPRLAWGAERTRPRAHRLDVPRQGHGEPRALRQGPARRSRPALHQPYVPALGRRRPRRSVRARCGADGLDRRRAHRPPVGRSGAHLSPAPRDLQHQLAVPRLRPAPLRHRGRVAQPRVAGAARVR